MKQKFNLKALLKKKSARLTIAEMENDPHFTVLNDEQKAKKKAGVGDEELVVSLNPNSPNNYQFNPKNNNHFGGNKNEFGSTSLPKIPQYTPPAQEPTGFHSGIGTNTNPIQLEEVAIDFKIKKSQ